ncbi:MAG: cell division protein ZapA [Gemmatimonadaceae bacterium]
MTTKKNIVTVMILGGEYTLRTETSPEHAQAIAAYVDNAISETMESGPRVEIHKAAILAALRIAGELFEAREQTRVLTSEMNALSDEIKPWLPPAKR